MDIFKCIMSRRTFRNYSDRVVDEDDLYLLVECGLHAPTSGNLQDFRFIVSREQNVLNKVAELCMEQGWIAKATGVIVVCSQPKKQRELYGPKGDHIYAVQNASAAAQNILLGAHALGLGACWVSGFDQQKIDDYFGVGDARVEVVIPIGYPRGKPDDKLVEEIDTVMYFDKYGNNKSNPDKLKKDYSKIVEESVKTWPEEGRNIFEKGKYLVKKHIFDTKKKIKK